MSDIVIRQVTQGIWTFSKPFARFGFVPIGGRSTAITLATGDVWLIPSTPLTPETKAKLDELGPVKYLIGPDVEHSMFIPEYHTAYPEAKIIGVKDLVSKKAGVIKFDGAYGQDPEGTKYGFEPEITACYFSGFVNKDVAFLHGPSKTLIEADLMFNLPANEQYSKSSSSGRVPIIGDLLAPFTTSHKRFLWSAAKDRPAMARDAKTVAGWDFDRIIPCHGDVIEKGGKAAWLECYKWHLEDKV